MLGGQGSSGWLHAPQKLMVSPQIPALADAGFRVIALEMKGYGESTAPPGELALLGCTGMGRELPVLRSRPEEDGWRSLLLGGWELFCSCHGSGGCRTHP